ncbi:MAG: histidine phosphotransferase family protein, partial [Rhodospirillales bacterium]
NLGGSVGDDPAARELLANSAGVATRRLAFFRIAFGSGAGAGGEATLPEARELAQGFIESGKAALDWPGDLLDQPSGALDPSVVKVLLCLVLIASEALPRGGDIGVNFADLEDGLGVAVVVAGERPSLGDDIRHALELEGELEAELDGLTARNVHGFYAQSLARGMGSRIEFSEASSGGIQFAVLFPKTTIC